MKIRTIDMQEFFCHEATRLELPDQGVFMFTGRNGHGKSSVIEAVSVAFWNKTLRSTPPWPRDASAAGVTITTDLVEAKRSVVKDKTKLSWNRLGEEPFKGETTTKTQKALERIVGSHETWRHSCVFSSADAALFSNASDIERKTLIENVLGLGRFEAAYRSCKAQILEKDKAVRTHTDKVRGLSDGLEIERQRLDEHQGSLQAQPPEVSEKDRVAYAKYITLAASTGEEIAALKASIDKHRREAGRVEGAASQATASYKSWAGKKVCHVCTQPVGQNLLNRLKGDMEQSVTVAEIAKSEALSHLKQLEKELQELQQEQEAIGRMTDTVGNRIALGDNAAEQRVRLQKLVKQVEQTITQKDKELQETLTLIEPLTEELIDLRMAELVLHYRGVRAQILSETLDGLETLTNVWLAELSDTLRVHIKSYTETKSGSTNDAISIEIEGAGEGYGYRATSGGERRRVDIAFLLALIQLAEAANGRDGDALFLDEVFDSLDDEVVPRLGAAIATLAAQRQVFVISHAEAVKTLLPVTHHFVVEDGKVAEAA